MKRSYLAVLGFVLGALLPNAASEETDSKGEAKLPPWVEMLSFKGDFRFRYEYLDEEEKSARNRWRIKTRLFVGAEVNEVLDFGLQLASGEDDPVSNNQTLTEGFSPKEIWIDMAYMRYRPWKEEVDFDVYAGKFQNPFVVMSKSELLWDPDLRPEGVAFNYSRDFTDSFNYFLNAGYFAVQERSSSADARLVGGQTGARMGLGGEASITAGAGYYDYGKLEGEATLFFPDSGEGNTVVEDPGGNTFYTEDYNELEVFAELETKLGELPFAVFGNYVKNVAADESDEDTGWAAGLRLGEVKKPGDWGFRWYYRVLEADAVLGLFTDSDFVNGGTDGQGHEFNIDYGLAKNWTAALTYFLNESGIAPGEEEQDFKRLQADLQLKF
ncbi:MAG: putative porin [Planctomycetota bacterium]